MPVLWCLLLVDEVADDILVEVLKRVELFLVVNSLLPGIYFATNIISIFLTIPRLDNFSIFQLSGHFPTCSPL